MPLAKPQKAACDRSLTCFSSHFLPSPLISLARFMNRADSGRFTWLHKKPFFCYVFNLYVFKGGTVLGHLRQLMRGSNHK